jgi:hypothetical protein
MITLIILIVLVAIGGYLTTKWNYEVLGIIMCVIFGLWLIIHSFCWGLVSYEYGLFVEKRNAFEYTLQVARENGNEYETAAIVKEVAQWNVKLAEYKYDNNTLYFDQYIDDRIEFLEPIK